MHHNTEIHFLEDIEEGPETNMNTLALLAERGPEEMRGFYTRQLTAARRLRKRNLKRLEELTHEPTDHA